MNIYKNMLGNVWMLGGLRALLVCSALFWLTGCANRALEMTEALSRSDEWRVITHNTSLPVKSWGRGHAAVVNVYIEGDGRAYIRSNRPADDPTPHNPLVISMTMQDTSPAAAYLARPCQYIQNNMCTRHVWTTGRFSEDVVQAMDAAVTRVKKDAGATSVRLIGFSGGGAIAALLAARRNDVETLVTVCGNLDHKAWTEFFELTPLYDSLNPVTVAHCIQGISQVHLLSTDDEIIVPTVIDSFKKEMKGNKRIKFIVVSGFAHNDEKWVEQVHSLALLNQK